MLEAQNKNGKKMMTYRYRSLQEIDDVILQLLNEADIEGFVKGFLDKKAGCVNYDVTGYEPLSALAPGSLSRHGLWELLDNLYRLLAYLEDSFIDLEYVIFDAANIYMKAAEKKLYLIVLPCPVSDSDETLGDCLEHMIRVYGADDAADKAYYDKAQERIRRGIRSLVDFQEILVLLGEEEHEAAASEPAWSVLAKGQAAKAAVSQPSEPKKVSDADGRTEEPEKLEEAAIIDLNLDDLLLRDILPDINEPDGYKEKDEACVQKDDGQCTEIHEEIRSELRAEVREELRSELRAEVREEVRSELRAEICGEVRDELRAEIHEEVRNELREEVRNELRSELMDEIRAEIAKELEREASAEVAEEIVPSDMDKKHPYLIRKATGEVIQLNKDTFIIGKMITCCDYVIQNNNAISRLHAVIKYNETADHYYIADCNSTNHIYLNGRRLPEDQIAVLEDRMHIHLATEEFIFRM